MLCPVLPCTLKSTVMVARISAPNRKEVEMFRGDRESFHDVPRTRDHFSPCSWLRFHDALEFFFVYLCAEESSDHCVYSLLVSNEIKISMTIIIRVNPKKNIEERVSDDPLQN